MNCKLKYLFLPMLLLATVAITPVEVPGMNKGTKVAHIGCCWVGGGNPKCNAW